jgi:hypothetical protein
MGTVAVDGSRVKANASKHEAMSYGRMRSEEDLVCLATNLRRMHAMLAWT